MEQIPTKGALILGKNSIDTQILDDFLGFCSGNTFYIDIKLRKKLDPNNQDFTVPFKQLKWIEFIDVTKNGYRLDLQLKVKSVSEEESTWYASNVSSKIKGYTINMGLKMSVEIPIEKVKKIYFNR